MRVIPPTYIGMSKSFFNYKSCWHTAQGSDDPCVMLGGFYHVLSSLTSDNDSYYVLLNLNENNSGAVKEENLTEVAMFQKCPFRVGDKISFAPRCTEEDINYLNLIGSQYELHRNKKTHNVTEVLNDYYVFIDYEKGSELSFPFRWIDFTKEQ